MDPTIIIIGTWILVMGFVLLLWGLAAKGVISGNSAVIVSCIIFAIWFCYSISIFPQMPLFPSPLHGGEIRHWYANGTVLLDNGTRINISDIPGLGCGS